jgi:hypothetical protein
MCFTEPNLDWMQYWIKQINKDHGRQLSTMQYSAKCHNTPAKRAYKPISAIWKQAQICQEWDSTATKRSLALMEQN